MLGYLLCKIRNGSFWVLDFLKGGLVKNAYEEIKKIDNMNSNDSYIASYQNQAFDELAEHS